MRPDVLVTWPLDCDYPLWRGQVREQRDRFQRVIVVFSQHHFGDISAFVSEQLLPDGVEFYWPDTVKSHVFSRPLRSDDWRDRAVNFALDASDAEWVWFTEQDFLVDRPDEFWDGVSRIVPHAEAIGWRQDDRWHPSCLFVERSLVEHTSRYFGSDPVDHFWSFGRDLDRLTDVLRIAPQDAPFHHLAGLSSNHQLLGEGREPNYRADEFAEYLRDCLALEAVELEPGWKRTVRTYLGMTP